MSSKVSGEMVATVTDTSKVVAPKPKPFAFTVRNKLMIDLILSLKLKSQPIRQFPIARRSRITFSVTRAISNKLWVLDSNEEVLLTGLCASSGHLLDLLSLEDGVLNIWPHTVDELELDPENLISAVEFAPI